MLLEGASDMQLPQGISVTEYGNGPPRHHAAMTGERPRALGTIHIHYQSIRESIGGWRYAQRNIAWSLRR